MKTGTKISLCRKKAGFSQEQLALKLNISRQAVSRWETGEAIPDTERIIQLSKMFGVSTDYLLLEEIEEVEWNTGSEDENKDKKTPSEYNKLNKKNCAFVMLIIGVLCIFATIIAAGLYSERMTEWHTAYGRFETALLHTWRAFFLYVGIGLVIIAIWILGDIGKRIAENWEL